MDYLVTLVFSRRAIRLAPFVAEPPVYASWENRLHGPGDRHNGVCRLGDLVCDKPGPGTT